MRWGTPEPSEVTAEYLRKIFKYDPETGLFTRLVRTGGAGKVGDVSNAKHSRGYRVLRTCGHLYKVHRLAWLYMTGEWPAHQVDHINGIHDDNRWCNLRSATNGENQQNRRKPVDNTSGYVGVSFHKADGRWRAYISVNKKQHSLGYYKTKEEAALAYAEGKRRLHAFHPVTTDSRADAVEADQASKSYTRKRSYLVSPETRAKLSDARRKRFAAMGDYNQRDERGCFVSHPAGLVGSDER